MNEQSANSNRIATNTLLLYVRSFITMIIALYTSRLILRNLGVTDYGIYNVVGGVVSSFAILTGSLSSSISRFLTFALGKGDMDKIKTVFSSSVNVQIVLMGIVLVIGETLGLWFINQKLNVPPDRLSAAMWVYQLSLLTFLVTILNVPYNASIIAHERMSAYAYISVLDAVLKLGVAVCIAWSPIDKLVFYAVLMMVSAVLIQCLYLFYCKRNFEECHYIRVSDKKLYKELFSFAGWNYLGEGSSILKNQGCSILLNIYFGPIVNAARGIADQVSNAATIFSSNFMTAVKPQITKSYSLGDIPYMHNLIYRGSIFSYYLLLLISLPLLLNTEFILDLWLTTVPGNAVLFVKLVLIYTLIHCISYPLITGMMATGKIRGLQIVVGGLELLNLPVTFLFLYNGAPAYIVYFVAIGIDMIGLMARLFFIHRAVRLSYKSFFVRVLFRAFIVTSLSVIIPYLHHINSENNIVGTILNVLLSCLSVAVVVYFIGLNSVEKDFAIRLIKNKFKHD